MNLILAALLIALGLVAAAAVCLLIFIAWAVLKLSRTIARPRP